MNSSNSKLLIELLLLNNSYSGIVIKMSGPEFVIVPSDCSVLSYFRLSANDWIEFKSDIRIKMTKRGMSKTALHYTINSSLVLR